MHHINAGGKKVDILAPPPGCLVKACPSRKYNIGFDKKLVLEGAHLRRGSQKSSQLIHLVIGRDVPFKI
jgi:hypothetical protein